MKSSGHCSEVILNLLSLNGIGLVLFTLRFHVAGAVLNYIIMNLEVTLGIILVIVSDIPKALDSVYSRSCA